MVAEGEKMGKFQHGDTAVRSQIKTQCERANSGCKIVTNMGNSQGRGQLTQKANAISKAGSLVSPTST